MPTIHVSKIRSEAILSSYLETGYPCVGVMLKAFQTSSCDQGEEIATNEGMAQGRPHGSFSLAQEAALAEIDRIMNDSRATPADHGTNAVLIQTLEDSEIRYGVIGLHSSSTSDLSAVTELFYAEYAANEEDADDMRASAESCQ